MPRGEQLATRIDASLEASGAPSRAASERLYLKSELVHYGVPMPALRAVIVAELRTLRDLNRAELLAAVKKLWSPGVFELRMAAVELLVKRVALLGALDTKLVERLLRESKTWALVDVLATHVMGPLVTAHASLGRTLDRWAKHKDFWMRRSAMLALLAPMRQGGGDFQRFARYADAMLDDKEFFIRKAIGWILRDTSRRRPALVYKWLKPRAARLSGVTLREAVKYLTAAQRREITRLASPVTRRRSA